MWKLRTGAFSIAFSFQCFSGSVFYGEQSMLNNMAKNKWSSDQQLQDRVQGILIGLAADWVR
jgi:hypothetical protein